MVHAKNTLGRLMALCLLVCAGLVALGFTGPIGALAAGPAPIDLLSAGDFVILAETGITNTGSHTTAITGNIGNSPGTAAQMNGVWCSEITGTIYGVNAAYTGSGDITCYAGNPPLANKTKVDTAVDDMLTAYNNAAGIVSPAPAVDLYSGNLGGKTLAPGLYKWNTAVTIPTDVTLFGGANDVWIFQMSGDLNIAAAGSVAAGTKVLLSGGAQASNIFWQVGGGTGATLGTYSTFNGTILSAKQIILETGAVLNGRALAQTQVILDANEVNVPMPCPTITLSPPPPLSQGTVGEAYSQTITASGGTEPYTFSVTAGSLPTGLSPITNDGIISGIPTATGTFTFTVTATDDDSCTGLREYTIVINAATCPDITLSSAPPLPQGTEGVTYSQTLTASGGMEPYTFSVTAGSLPTGLPPITNDGIISGTPTTAGTFTFTVTATDNDGCTGLQAYTIVINAAVCPTISLLPAPPLPQGTEGDAYSSQTITASGGTGPYTFSVTAGSLPTGLPPITSDGIISGTPTAAGTFTFTVTATDTMTGCKGLEAYTIVINAAACPTISLLPAPPLPQGIVLATYSQTITASGGTGPYSFSVTTGSLPTGLSPITSGGLISGTPTVAGTFTFTVTATDTMTGCKGLRAYTIIINAVSCPAITLSPAPPLLQEAAVGEVYSQPITASGGQPPYTYSVTTGALPTGLMFNTGTGLISGRPTATGTFRFTVTATSLNGCTGLQAYTILVNSVIPTLSEWGMIIFMLFMGLVSIYYLKRRRITP